MPYKLTMPDDGILRINFDGALEDDEIDPFINDFMRYLEAATPTAPLRTLTISNHTGAKLAPRVRKMFATLNTDPRLGKSATIGVDRYTRVLVGFVLKATGRDNIRFFDSEEQALAWLKS
ncbi:MAG TPA: hypothetical protein PLJ78_03575 [Anaerolineae bacterium]|nr:hypothetical protein [Anaerolineae bacterium]HQK13009.1 hypothetical protein [Anaerolineae bacterium]